MKKMIWLVCLSQLLMLFQVNAQFGIAAGLNLADLTAAGYQARRSVNLGGYAQFSINENWQFRPEIMFSSQGAKQIIPGEEKVVFLSYANVPLLLQYKWGNGFMIHSGPQVGVLASARKSPIVKGTSNELITNYKALDLAWVFGASYISSKRVGVQARVVPGLTNISKTPYYIKNNVFQVSIFYQFKKVKKPQ